MLSFDLLLDRLCAYLASQATLTYLVTPRAIWRNAAVENDETLTAQATDPFSVLRQFAGGLDWVPQAKASIQCRTLGKRIDLTLARAELLYGKLLDADGRPARNLVLAAAPGGVRINAVDVTQAPAFVEIDEQKRAVVAWNVDLRAVPLA